MPFVRIPPETVAPGEPVPFDVYDQRGRLLCKAWVQMPLDRRWPWGSLFTTSDQLEAYKKRFVQEAKKIIDDPNARLGSLIDLHVTRPPSVNQDGKYLTPGQRYVEKILGVLDAARKSLANHQGSSWGPSELEGILADSVELYSAISQHPEISMIVARRELQLSVSGTEAAAALYCYFLGAASWIGASSQCPSAMKSVIVPFAVIARLGVTQMREQSKLRKPSDQFSGQQICAYLFEQFNGQSQAAAVVDGSPANIDSEAVAPPDPNRDEVHIFLAPAFALMRLECARLSNILGKWDWGIHRFQMCEEHYKVSATERQLERIFGQVWPGDFVELASGDIALVAGIDPMTNLPIVLRLVAADGLPLARPMRARSDLAGHRIARRLDSHVPRFAFDPRLVADVVL